MSLAVTNRPQENFTFNPRVQSAPAQQPRLAPKVVTQPVQPTLAPKVVTQPVQPQFNPQVQSQPAPEFLPDIHVDNSPRFTPLGEAVKLKFPGVYDDMDSGQLGKIVAMQYPGIYDDLVLPAYEDPTPEQEETGRGGLIGFGTGALKGAVSTIANIGNLGQKALEKLTGLDGGPTPTEYFGDTIKPRGFAEKAGFGTEQIAEFFIPATKIGQAAKAIDAGVQGLNYGSKTTKTLQLAGKMGLGAADAGATTLLQTSDANQAKNAAIFGGVFPIGVGAITKLGSAANEVAKFVSSSLSGVPKEAIEYALKNPQKVQSAIRQAAEEGGDAAAQRIHSNALNALDELRNARRTNYESGLEKLQKEATYTKDGQLYVKRVLNNAEAKATKGYVPGTVIGVPTNLTTNGIKKVATTTLKEFDIKAKGKVIDWSEAAIDNNHGKKLQEIVNRIYNWGDNTPTGLNKLRKVIDGYKLGGVNLGSSEKQFNAIVGKLRTNLSEYVGERVPQIAEMNNKYRLESEVIDAVRSQLKIGSADPNTALRKLVNVFNPKSQVYRPMVEQLGEKAGVDLMSDIAALTMLQWTPEGLGKYLTGLTSGAGIGLGFINPAALATLPVTAAVSSPKIVGKAATTLGKIGQNKVVQKIKKAAPRAGLGLGSQIVR